MGQKYLIDSNCIIDFCNGKLPAPARELFFTIEQPIISVITQIEVLGFEIPNKKEEKLLRDFVSIAMILPLNLQVASKTIDIKKNIRIKLPDAVISATALQFNLILLTRNVSDFKNITGLKLQNPWDL
ncbi:type II toxin-antitoxin system VapC family toxin [Niabella sp.]|uniref:type II toxin-antitoxin system VapC family toxin n=1 Tax=Niabella sp. TaxID=1962976 RepID=UPI0026174471|nr:type II toxin-antitoxin system VapC family toxin [Niabella sp.]